MDFWSPWSIYQVKFRIHIRSWKWVPYVPSAPDRDESLTKKTTNTHPKIWTSWWFFTNPVEKHACQNGSFSEKDRVKQQKKCLTNHPTPPKKGTSSPALSETNQWQNLLRFFLSNLEGICGCFFLRDPSCGCTTVYADNPGNHGKPTTCQAQLAQVPWIKDNLFLYRVDFLLLECLLGCWLFDCWRVQDSENRSEAFFEAWKSSFHEDSIGFLWIISRLEFSASPRPMTYRGWLVFRKTNP